MNLVWKVVSSNPDPPRENWVIKNKGKKTHKKWLKIISADNNQKKKKTYYFFQNFDIGKFKMSYINEVKCAIC